MDQLFMALHSAALNARGGITGLAQRMGKRQQTLINKLNPHDDTHQPNLGEFVAILLDTGDLFPLEVLATMLGAKVVTRHNRASKSVVLAMLHAAKEHGDLADVVERALADGHIDTKERIAILREVSELRDALTTMENTLREGVEH